MTKRRAANIDALGDVLSAKGKATPISANDASTTTQPAPPDPAKKIDGRSLRKTGRTTKFAASVTPEWANDLKQTAANEGRLIVEILEDALKAYHAQK